MGPTCIRMFPQPSATTAILMYNLVDFAAGSLAFGVIGFGIAFGTNSQGGSGPVAGAGAFMLVGPTVDFAKVFFEMSFCVTCVTILSGALAGRARFSRYVFVPLLISGVWGASCGNSCGVHRVEIADHTFSVHAAAFIYPIGAHASWDKNGWLYKLGYLDFGETVCLNVHHVKRSEYCWHACRCQLNDTLRSLRSRKRCRVSEPDASLLHILRRTCACSRLSFMLQNENLPPLHSPPPPRPVL